MDKKEKTLKIKLIKRGISIDHIKHGKAPEVLKILGISNGFPDSVTLAMNIPSKARGSKDIVKVENRDLDPKEMNQIAIIAPHATINWIEDYKVVKKMSVSLPEDIIGIVRCPNPICITNKEREPVKSVFHVRQNEPLVLRCKYCERDVS
ncbi:MAG: aspartate carbamoyltransferase regulatory subunit [Candidatus Altiarchaeota archaeon]|nr:aspartate carbamoyltransferase regulatory subunit [Candidatus Altiarchaeota archaeon]MBU4266471.1 aspartate carbamoyltransferase regulatory subunit [Candidatus Altiarchaeota archaeon]MBU4437240.1 aspartate carbamoyltransferase regulatory subunit [Candidatus Altiarchaeota archaeon]